MTVTRRRLAPEGEGRPHPAVTAWHRHAERVYSDVERCACTHDRICGYHFSQLDPDQRRAAQVAAGVRPPLGR
jgi:hypothetical protein